MTRALGLLVLLSSEVAVVLDVLMRIRRLGKTLSFGLVPWREQEVVVVLFKFVCRVQI
jgi:hypothetical protein